MSGATEPVFWPDIPGLSTEGDMTRTSYHREKPMRELLDAVGTKIKNSIKTAETP
jgi:hypothetical protein